MSMKKSYSLIFLIDMKFFTYDFRIILNVQMNDKKLLNKQICFWCNYLRQYKNTLLAKRISYSFLLNVPHAVLDCFAKYQEARIFISYLKKKLFYKKKKFYVFRNFDE